LKHSVYTYCQMSPKISLVEELRLPLQTSLKPLIFVRSIVLLQLMESRKTRRNILYRKWSCGNTVCMCCFCCCCCCCVVRHWTVHINMDDAAIGDAEWGDVGDRANDAVWIIYFVGRRRAGGGATCVPMSQIRFQCRRSAIMPSVNWVVNASARSLNIEYSCVRN